MEYLTIKTYRTGHNMNGSNLVKSTKRAKYLTTDLKDYCVTTDVSFGSTIISALWEAEHDIEGLIEDLKVLKSGESVGKGIEWYAKLRKEHAERLDIDIRESADIDMIQVYLLENNKEPLKLTPDQIEKELILEIEELCLV